MSQDVRASNLNDAWGNFNPDQPLAGDSPFFIDYESRPLNRFKRALLRNPDQPMRFFLAGFRGSGKSSHINRLAIDPQLNDKFLIAKYSIQNACDLNDITVVDLMLSMTSSIIGSLPQDLDTTRSPAKEIIDNLHTWGQRTVERVRTRATETGVGVDLGAQGGYGIPFLGSLFAKITAKMRTEASSRTTIREVLEPQLSDLIANLNLLAKLIDTQVHRPLLVLVDDTDKLEHRFTNNIFHEGFPNLSSLAFHVLYTVREFTFFSSDFPEIKAGSPSADMLRNVRLWEQTSRDTDCKGVKLLTQFVHGRMDPSLIEQDTALKQAAHYSGGIFRQFANIMQIAIDHALEQDRGRVEADDVEFAANELRKGLLRTLTTKDKVELRYVYHNHDHPNRAQITLLFLLLAIIEYENGDFWYDVNPVLWPDFAGEP